MLSLESLIVRADIISITGKDPTDLDINKNVEEPKDVDVKIGRRESKLINIPLGKSLIEEIKEERQTDFSYLKELSLAKKNRSLHSQNNDSSWLSGGDMARLLKEKEEELEPRRSIIREVSQEKDVDAVKVEIPENGGRNGERELIEPPTLFNSGEHSERKLQAEVPLEGDQSFGMWENDCLEMQDLDDYRAPILFDKGVPANTCYMVLSGKVGVRSGKDEFYSEVGSFGVLGSRGLFSDDYIPDFSAEVIGECRLLRITRQLYLRVLQ